MFGAELPAEVQLLAAQQMGIFAQQQQDLATQQLQQQQLQQQLQQQGLFEQLQQQQLLQQMQLQQQLQAQTALAPSRPKPKSKNNMKRKNKNCPVLSQETIQAIGQELAAHGGRLPMGKLCQKFEGVSRGQLEGVFELSTIGVHGQVEVRLPGMEPVGVMMYGGEVVSQDMPLPPLEQEQIDQITAMIEAVPNGMAPLSRITHMVKGVKRQQIETLFEISAHRMGDKKRHYVRKKGTPMSDTEAMTRWKAIKELKAAGHTEAAQQLSAKAFDAANAQLSADAHLQMAQHMMALGANPMLPGMTGQASVGLGGSGSASSGVKRTFSEAGFNTNVK